MKIKCDLAIVIQAEKGLTSPQGEIKLDLHIDNEYNVEEIKALAEVYSACITQLMNQIKDL